MKNVKFLIPARMGSKGLPFKNRSLFEHTAKIIPPHIRSICWVSSDDPEILKQAYSWGFNFYERPSEISQDKSSTKEVVLDFIKRVNPKDDTLIIVLYLTYPERTWEDVTNFIKNTWALRKRSALCQKKHKGVHPYLLMNDLGNGDGSQLVNHNLYRRQDYPPVFEISHFIIGFYANEVNNLNNNLYNENTHFFRIGEVIDVDEKKDLARVSSKTKSLEKKVNNQPITVENFPKMLENKTICVVGPSTNLIGKGYGTFIDSFDIVIRFNGSLPIPNDSIIDYGKKTDILCINGLFGKTHNMNHYDSFFKNGLQLILSKTLINNNPKILKLNPQSNNQLLLGNILIENLIKYKPSRIHITGIDFYKRGVTSFKNDYHDKLIMDRLKSVFGQSVKIDPSSSHDIEVNIKHLQKIVKENPFIDVDHDLLHILRK